MKFFEGFKKDIKKVAVGSAVVVASLSPMKSTAQENISDANLDETEVNKVDTSTTSMDPEFYRNEYIKYMEHPSYKKRLAKEMYGNDIISEEKAEVVNTEYKRRLDKIKNVTINITPDVNNKKKDQSRYHISSDSINATPYAVFHELSHEADTFSSKEKGFEDIKNKYITDTKKTYTDFLNSEESKKYNQNCLLLTKAIEENIVKNNDSIKSEIEKREGYDVFKLDIFKFYKDLKKEDQNKIYSNNKELIDVMENYINICGKLFSNMEYYGENTEIKARLNELRFRAINEFNFNLDDVFDINNFDELKNDSPYKDLKDKLGLSDNQINELMKYTAVNIIEDNNQNKDVNNYA